MLAPLTPLENHSEIVLWFKFTKYTVGAIPRSIIFRATHIGPRRPYQILIPLMDFEKLTTLLHLPNSSTTYLKRTSEALYNLTFERTATRATAQTLFGKNIPHIWIGGLEELYTRFSKGTLVNGNNLVVLLTYLRDNWLPLGNLVSNMSRETPIELDDHELAPLLPTISSTDYSPTEPLERPFADVIGLMKGTHKALLELKNSVE